MNDDETLELLREAHREPIAEAHYAAVRARVMSQLASRRRWRMWVYGFASVALAAMLVIAIRTAHWNAEQALPPANRTLAHAGRTQPPMLERAVQTRGAVGRRKRLAHRDHIYRVTGPPALQPLLVKLVTDDPNIVIYWISGE